MMVTQEDMKQLREAKKVAGQIKAGYYGNDEIELALAARTAFNRIDELVAYFKATQNVK